MQYAHWKTYTRLSCFSEQGKTIALKVASIRLSTAVYESKEILCSSEIGGYPL